MMREIQASEAKTHLPRLLDEVERGATLVITRHGRPIARLVPENDRKAEAVAEAIAAIDRIRTRSRRVTREEILQSVREGRRF